MQKRCNTRLHINRFNQKVKGEKAYNHVDGYTKSICEISTSIHVKKKNTWQTRDRRKLLKSGCYKDLWQTLYLMVKY